MSTYTLDELSRFIDHTNLHADATKHDMSILCEEAKNYHFKMVAINQVQSAYCYSLLKDTDIGIGAAISFPFGQTSIASKVFETEDAIKNGATEIDYVVNLTAVKDGDWDYVREEMIQMVTMCHKYNRICKVIFENAYLVDEEIIKLSQIAKDVGPDFIKTSTGYAPSGATLEDVALMVKHAGPNVKVKAAGGIRDAKTFKAMIKAGAKRIGSSSGITIINQLKEEMADSGKTEITIE